MFYIRNALIFLEFLVLFFLFNPFLLTYLNLPFNTYELQRLLQWAVISLSLLHLSIDKAVRLHSFGFLQSLAAYKKGLLIFILILGTISSLHAYYPAYALMELATFYGLFLMTLLFTGLFCMEKEAYLQRFYTFILITFAVNCASALLMLFYFLTVPSFHTVGDPFTLLASPGYVNRRFYDDVACMALPILIMLSVYKQNNKVKISWLIFMVVAYLYARGIVSHSRIYFFEPLALFILFPLFYRRKAGLFLMLQAAAILGGAALYYLFYVHHGVEPAHFPDRTFLNNRLLLWIIAAKLILLHPLFGVGPLHFNFYAHATETYAAHPHSALLVIASEWGIPVFLAVLILSVTGLYACIKNRNLMPIGLMGALIGGFLMMQIDGLILMPAGQSMLCLILAWAFACHGEGVTAITQWAIPRYLSCILLGLGCIALALMLGVGVPILVHMNQVVANFMSHCSGDCDLSPDYWSQGFIQYYSPIS